MTTWTTFLSDSLDGLPDKDRQSAKTRDTSEICRYAPPSCSPEDGNIYGDAATSDGADESTTVSNPPVIRQECRPPSETTATRTTSSTVRAVDS